MKTMLRTICLIVSFISIQAMAIDAPVVDDTENFALLEEQPQAADELPVAHESYAIRNDGTSEPALVSESARSTSLNTELLNKIQALQQDIQDLRGQLEVQAHEISELKQQQLSSNEGSDARLNPASLPTNPQAIEESQQAIPASHNKTVDTLNAEPLEEHAPIQAQIDVAPIPQALTASRSNPADEQISYLAAYELVKQKQSSKASVAMQQFLSQYPHGGYSANAYYWLGELYLERKEYASAMTQFDKVIQEFKSSSKYAPSRLKLAYALADSGRVGEAKEQLTALMKAYPDTATAHLAHVKLEKLGG